MNRIFVNQIFRGLMSEFENILSRIGENIKELRKLNNWTQTELAERSKRPQSSIARVEGATYGDVSLSLVYDLCQTLGVSFAEVLAMAEGKKSGKTTKKVKLTTKWEKVRAKVNVMSESEKSWIAEVISTLLGKRGVGR